MHLSGWFGRQKPLGILGGLVAGVTLIHLTSALTLDRIISYPELTYPSKKLPPSLDGYTIAFLSDTHDVTQKQLAAIVAQINHRQVDLVLLGGDYGQGNRSLPALSALSKITTRDGIFGVGGNHDSHKATFAQMKMFGIRPLNNEGLYLHPGFYLAGVADWLTQSVRVSQALSTAVAGDFVLLVSHNPDLAMERGLKRVNLVLSGHTHGGQITLFGRFKPALFLASGYGHTFGGGWAKGRNGLDVLVSKGVSGHGIKLRTFARPEVIFLTLQASS